MNLFCFRIEMADWKRQGMKIRQKATKQLDIIQTHNIITHHVSVSSSPLMQLFNFRGEFTLLQILY